MGAVYKVYHAIFGQFDPLPLPHFVTHPGTPQKYVTHLGPPFLVGLVQKPGQKPPVQILSIVRGGFYPGRFVRGSFAWKVLYGWFLSNSPSVRIHLLQQKGKHHF